MLARPKTLLICAVITASIAGGAAAFFVARATASNTKNTSTQKPERGPTIRNLSLQPEAIKLARLLGLRFSPAKKTTSVVTGTLTIGSETRTMQMTRKQTEDGETVEIAMAGSAGVLGWEARNGALAPGRQANRSERELIERLALDSPDQFVLMQLRGASYYTVAQGVRPTDAAEGYDGPLWTIVRVDDPEQDQSKRPASPWRLYYLNTTTGLIDQIESEVEGERIMAEITWTEQNGEKLPAQIVWTRFGQTLMQYSLTNFSHAQN